MPHGMRPLAVSGRIWQRKNRGDCNTGGGRTAQKCAAIAGSWYKQYHADMELLFGAYWGVIAASLLIGLFAFFSLLLFFYGSFCFSLVFVLFLYFFVFDVPW